MIIASAKKVDVSFLAAVASALDLLQPGSLGPFQGLALWNANRFRKVNADAAKAFVCDYLASEHEAMDCENEPFTTDFIVELEASSTVCCFVKLTTPGKMTANAYGCSVRRINENDYVIDGHSPVFAAKWRWLIR